MDKKVVLVSHGTLASAMMESVQMIIGKNDDLMCFGLNNDLYCSDIAENIKSMAENNKSTQYIVIADLLGGSVCNECNELALLHNVKVISGMNMKLVIELLLEDASVTDEIIESKIELCREGIINISEQAIKKNNACSKEDFF
ncbi:MAG: hypothetical protein Q4F66_13515 [Clostridium sp.]|nr:hypothetical protein [Clostridium sp.]